MKASIAIVWPNGIGYAGTVEGAAKIAALRALVSDSPADAQAQVGGGWCVEKARDPDFPQWAEVKELIVPAPPSAPFVVKHYTDDEGPTIKGNGFDGLRIGDDRAEAEEFVRWVNAALAQQPATITVRDAEHGTVEVTKVFPGDVIAAPYDTAPPSAPVGVVDRETERRLIDVAASMLNDNNGKIGKRHFRADATAVVRRVLKALAQQPAVVDGAMELVRDIAEQKPEKPDYWSSCSQCEHNIDRAQEVLAAIAQQPAADPLVEWGNRSLNFTATVGAFKDGVQPAAVDGAMVKRAIQKARNIADGAGRHPAQGPKHADGMRRACNIIEASLAAQPGGYEPEP